MQCISTSASSRQDVGHIHQLDPVELEVGAGGEMAEALVIFARDMGQLAQLPRRQGAVGNGDAQHVGMQLQIEAVHQPQRLELVFGQFARQAALDLAGELLHALADELGVEFVIAVHVGLDRLDQGVKHGPACLPVWGCTVGPAARMISRSFTGTILPFCVTHLEQIGRHELVAGQFGCGRGQGGIGAGLHRDRHRRRPGSAPSHRPCDTARRRRAGGWRSASGGRDCGAPWARKNHEPAPKSRLQHVAYVVFLNNIKYLCY